MMLETTENQEVLTMAVKQKEFSGWVGWIYFAAFMLLLLGGLQMMVGLAGIFQNEFFVVTEQRLMVLDFTAWGWTHLLLGIGLFVTGIAVLAGNVWARLIAIGLTILSAIAQLGFINAYPLWSIISLIIDGFIIYALTMHGDELRQ